MVYVEKINDYKVCSLEKMSKKGGIFTYLFFCLLRRISMIPSQNQTLTPIQDQDHNPIDYNYNHHQINKPRIRRLMLLILFGITNVDLTTQARIKSQYYIIFLQWS